MSKKILLSAILLLPFFNVSAQIPVIAADIDPGSYGSNPISLTVFNSNLFFLANVSGPTSPGELWKFDGTVASKISLPVSDSMVEVSPFAIANNKMFFFGPMQNINWGLHSFWSIDNSGNTTKITDSIRVDGQGLVSIGTKVYFVGNAFGPAYDFNGIYVYDAVAGTIARKLKIYGGSVTFAPLDTIQGIAELTVYNNKIYFIGYRNSISDTSELFVFDPVSNTANMVTTLSVANTGSAPRSLFVADNNKLYFSAFAPSEGRELYVIDGNNAPQKITSLNNISDGVSFDGYNNIAKLGNYIYFSGNNGTAGYELMRLDIANNATSIVKNINTSTNSSYPSDFYEYQGRLYFSATTDSFGTEPWVTDGTPNGTYMIADMVAGTGSSYPYQFTAFNNSLYFNGDDGFSGGELYRFSGLAGFESVKKTKDIIVYPNPTTASMTISLSLINAENLTVVLTDATGKTVYSSPAQQCAAGPNKLDVSLQHLPLGIYQYRIANTKNELIGAGSITRN